jgi:hypothetical protein
LIFTPDILAGLGAGFGGKPSGDATIHAVIDGIPVDVRFELRSHGSSSSKWTELAVKSADLKGFAFTFNFDVRPVQIGDAGDVRDGRLRDIVLGDAAFDEAFIVEAAPEAVVRHLLDAETRAEMLALRPLRMLSTSIDAVMIERPDWILDPALLARMTRLTVRIAAALIPAAREAARERRQNAEEGGYRGRAPTDDEIRAEWNTDVAAMNAQAERRQARSKRNALVVAIAILAIVIGIVGMLASR